MAQNLNGYMQQILMKTQEKMKPEETRCVHEIMTKLSTLGLMDPVIHYGVMGFYTDMLTKTTKAELEGTLSEMISLKEIKDSADHHMTSALNAVLAQYERAKAENN